MAWFALFTFAFLFLHVAFGRVEAVAMKQSTRRLLTHGTASLVTVMVLGVLVLLYVLADNFRHRVDLSEGGQNTLEQRCWTS